jgi:hypothetical protein
MSAAMKLKEHKTAKLAPSGLLRSEHARADWTITPAAHHVYEDVLEPVYWTHHAFSLKPGHKICVIPSDMSYYAELVVWFVADNTATVGQVVHVKNERMGETVDETLLPEGYKVVWVVGSRQYAVVRNNDKATLQSFVKKDDAVKWLIENRRNLVAS